MSSPFLHHLLSFSNCLHWCFRVGSWLSTCHYQSKVLTLFSSAFLQCNPSIARDHQHASWCVDIRSSTFFTSQSSTRRFLDSQLPAPHSYHGETPYPSQNLPLSFNSLSAPLQARVLDGAGVCFSGSTSTRGFYVQGARVTNYYQGPAPASSISYFHSDHQIPVTLSPTSLQALAIFLSNNDF